MSAELLDAGTWFTLESASTTSSTSCLTRPDHLCVLVLVVKNAAYCLCNLRSQTLGCYCCLGGGLDELSGVPFKGVQEFITGSATHLASLASTIEGKFKLKVSRFAVFALRSMRSIFSAMTIPGMCKLPQKIVGMSESQKLTLKISSLMTSCALLAAWSIDLATSLYLATSCSDFCDL